MIFPATLSEPKQEVVDEAPHQRPAQEPRPVIEPSAVAATPRFSIEFGPTIVYGLLAVFGIFVLVNIDTRAVTQALTTIGGMTVIYGVIVLIDKRQRRNSLYHQEMERLRRKQREHQSR